MILANNDFEQTLLLPVSVLDWLSDANAQDLTTFDEVQKELIESGFLDTQGKWTKGGERIVQIIRSADAEFSVSHLHAVDKNFLRLYIGQEESIVCSKLIGASGIAGDTFLFSRTTHENALQHVFAWMGLPVVDMPEDNESSISSELLTSRGFSEAARGWLVTCSALPGGLHIIFHQNFLWRVSNIIETGSISPLLALEGEDTLSFSMLIHYVWAQCFAEIG